MLKTPQNSNVKLLMKNREGGGGHAFGSALTQARHLITQLLCVPEFSGDLDMKKQEKLFNLANG